MRSFTITIAAVVVAASLVAAAPVPENVVFAVRSGEDSTGSLIIARGGDKNGKQPAKKLTKPNPDPPTYDQHIAHADKKPYHRLSPPPPAFSNSPAYREDYPQFTHTDPASGSGRKDGSSTAKTTGSTMTAFPDGFNHAAGHAVPQTGQSTSSSSRRPRRN